MALSMESFFQTDLAQKFRLKNRPNSKERKELELVKAGKHPNSVIFKPVKFAHEHAKQTPLCKLMNRQTSLIVSAVFNT